MHVKYCSHQKPFQSKIQQLHVLLFSDGLRPELLGELTVLLGALLQRGGEGREERGEGKEGKEGSGGKEERKGFSLYT